MIDAYTTTNRYPYAQTGDNEQLDARSGLRPRLQLRAQLGEGRGRRLRRHHRLLRDAGARTRSSRPTATRSRSSSRTSTTCPTGSRRTCGTRRTCSGCRRRCGASTTSRRPQEFYGGDDSWDVARDPGTTGAAQATRTTDANGNTVTSRNTRIEPYYLFTKLPGRDEPEFILLRPFVPVTRRGRQPGAHRLHGRPERRRRLREAARVRMPRGQTGQRPRHRAGRDPAQQRRVRERDPPRRAGLHGVLRQPHVHPDRRRPRLRAAVLRDVERAARSRASRR